MSAAVARADRPTVGRAAGARPTRRRFDLVEAYLRAHGTLAYLFLYVPIVIVVVYSFNDSRYVLSWGGVSLRWYQAAWTDPQVLNPLKTSLIVAALNMVIATSLGTLAALAIGRAPRWVRVGFDALIYTALIVPEVVIALASLLFLNAAFGALQGIGLRVSFGIPTIVAGHVLWNLSLVILVVRARIAGMDRSLIEASSDLFASPWRTFTQVTLPQLAPAIIAGALLSFTFSMDDVVLSTFLSGVGSTTLPMRVFSMIRFGVTPAVNAISTVMLALTLIAILLSQWLVRRAGRHPDAAGGAAG
ncbi:MAG TPA: ABC transporter permease [Candidatus Limnocylindrales bacterium]|nr:ABC transporter permease [Candidatus Limnocylindrales bacterium]